MSEGIKHDSGKLRYDLIPAMPLEQVVRVYTMGASKYADRNWENGLKWGRVFAAMMRHAWAFWRGEDFDKESGAPHLAHAAWCCLTLMEYMDTHRELDDRSPRIEVIGKTIHIDELDNITEGPLCDRPDMRESNP